jgi:DNA-binding IclR family transcriptional regulator
MPLPFRQIAVLRYLGDRKSATTGQVARELRLNRTAARNALRPLADNRLVSADHGTFPMSWSITDMGAAILAAASERDDR